MNKISFLLLLILSCAQIYADNAVTITTSVSEGSLFPDIYVQSLEDKYISLPYEITSNARVSLIILTFARPNDEDMASWVKPFADKYENNTRIAYYELALVGDVGIINGLIFNGMRGGATEQMRKHLLVYFHDKNPYRKMFNISDDSLIYNCLVDQNGVIRLIKSGKRAGEKDIAEIIKATESLLSLTVKKNNLKKSR